MDLIISNASGKPIYEQICTQIKNAILSGELSPGDALPSIRALAKDLRKLLPKYMLPNLYEKLEALPYNANGKIDRVALKERYLHAEG